MAYECGECGEVSGRGEYKHKPKCKLGRRERGELCANPDCDAPGEEIHTNDSRVAERGIRATTGWCCARCGEQWDVQDLGGGYEKVHAPPLSDDDLKEDAP